MSGVEDFSTGRIVNRSPLTIRRRARWGDCDPAGVVYTPRFTEYMVSAYETLIGLIFAGPPHLAMRASGISLPIKACSVVFHRSLWLEQEFEIVVVVGNIRSRTFDLVQEARDLEGQTIFSGVLSPICVDGERKSRAIPDDLRTLLRAEQDCRGQGGQRSTGLDQ